MSQDFVVQTKGNQQDVECSAVSIFLTQDPDFSLSPANLFAVLESGRWKRKRKKRDGKGRRGLRIRFSQIFGLLVPLHGQLYSALFEEVAAFAAKQCKELFKAFRSKRKLK